VAVQDYQAANVYLEEEYLPEHNRRFADPFAPQLLHQAILMYPVVSLHATFRLR